MKKKKMLTVVGARPQFIKASAVSRALSRFTNVQEIVVHTGQHYDENMSRIFFRELQMKSPEFNLEVGSADHGVQTGLMMQRLEPVMKSESPDAVILYGDTNSTLAGALVAAKLHIPVAHVEAGLRSFNKLMPEEINRILTDHISQLLFAPTEDSIKNLLNEGLKEENTKLVGDVMYDAALTHVDDSRLDRMMHEFNVKKGKYILATIHRAENTDCDARMRQIFKSLHQLTNAFQVLFLVHPRVSGMYQKLGFADQDSFKLIPPVGYLDMLVLEKHAHTIITDSGGVQKEAFFFNRPCVVVREETEWLELVEHSSIILSSPDKIGDKVFNYAPDTPTKTASALYGGGKAAQKIAHELLVYLS